MKKLISVAVVVLMLVCSVVPAFAANSPEVTTYKYSVTIVDTTGGAGTFEYTTDVNEKGEQTIHLRPQPQEGYVFDHWVIDGAYVAEGDLTDAELDLIISGDIKITPVYVKAGSQDSTDATAATSATISEDTSKTSPQTGSNNVAPFVVIILSLAACGAVATMLVKSKKG